MAESDGSAASDRSIEQAIDAAWEAYEELGEGDLSTPGGDPRPAFYKGQFVGQLAQAEAARKQARWTVWVGLFTAVVALASAVDVAVATGLLGSC